MATTRFIDHLLEGDHASRPAAGDVPEGTLYSCTTHSLVYQSDTSTWTTWATLGGGSGDLDAIIAASAGQNIADALAGAASPAAGNVFATMADIGGTVDPVFELFGTPATAYEFDTSSLSGLTALGSPDVENADTTIPDAYYVKDANGSYDWCGRYVTPPSTPYTGIVKILDFYPTANYNSAGMFIGVATPGNMDALHGGYNNGLKFQLERTTQSGFTSSIASFDHYEHGPVYLAIRVNSSSSVDYMISKDGWIWKALTLARNPSITIASIGWIIKSENTNGNAAAFDYFRLFTSALTFPGV